MQTSQASAPRPIRYGALSKPERGKLYFFSPSEGILVVRPWPVLKAWRKTPKRSFKQIRADISLADPPSVLPVSRRSGPPSGPTSPNPSEEELRALIEEWPVNSTDDDIAQPRMIRGFPYAKRWHAESDLRHRQVCRAFAESFPPAIRQVLARFGTRQWHLAKLAQLDGGLDLIKTNPGLAFCLASSWVFKRTTHPWRTARRLLRLKRRDAAGWLPGTLMAPLPCIAGVAFRVPDLAAQRARLAAAGFSVREVGNRLLVPAEEACGVAVLFES